MSTKKRQLLIIDNEPDQVEIREQWLKEANYDVHGVATLSGAWSYIEYLTEKNKKTPLILLDIMMPISDDLDWLEDYEKDQYQVSAPTAGLSFAIKLKKVYPEIQLAWHSVRGKTEPPVKKQCERLGFSVVQKDLQNRTEFLNEIKEAFPNE